MPRSILNLLIAPKLTVPRVDTFRPVLLSTYAISSWLSQMDPMGHLQTRHDGSSPQNYIMLTKLVVCPPHLHSRSNLLATICRLLLDIAPRIWIPVTKPANLRCLRSGPTPIRFKLASIIIFKYRPMCRTPVEGIWTSG